MLYLKHFGKHIKLLYIFTIYLFCPSSLCIFMSSVSVLLIFNLRVRNEELTNAAKKKHHNICPLDEYYRWIINFSDIYLLLENIRIICMTNQLKYIRMDL